MNCPENLIISGFIRNVVIRGVAGVSNDEDPTEQRVSSHGFNHSPPAPPDVRVRHKLLHLELISL